MQNIILGYLKLTLTACVVFIISPSVSAEPTKPDATALIGETVPPPENKDLSMYSIFNPVPADQLRQLSTDRPGKTHSSITVDAGHFQVESDFANYTYDHYSPNQQTTRAYSVGAPIVKAGITNWADLELAFAFYNHAEITDRTNHTTTKGSGFGDISLGSKINVFGNDGGWQSLALMPFIKLPTAASNVGNGVTEYTLNVPYTIELDNLWSLTSEPIIAFLKNSQNDELHGDYSFIVNLNRPVFVKTVTAALEVASEYASDKQIAPRYTLDPSLQWLVTSNLQLDVGTYIGLNKTAPDYVGYTGISFRY